MTDERGKLLEKILQNMVMPVDTPIVLQAGNNKSEHFKLGADGRITPDKSGVSRFGVFAYCETCETYFDLWKYDTLGDAGHSGSSCTVREVTDMEYRELYNEDEQWHDFEEDFLIPPKVYPAPPPRGRPRKNDAKKSEE
jgi:hypothetical protein